MIEFSRGRTEESKTGMNPESEMLVAKSLYQELVTKGFHIHTLSQNAIADIDQVYRICRLLQLKAQHSFLEVDFTDQDGNASIYRFDRQDSINDLRDYVSGFQIHTALFNFKHLDFIIKYQKLLEKIACIAGQYHTNTYFRYFEFPPVITKQHGTIRRLREHRDNTTLTLQFPQTITGYQYYHENEWCDLTLKQNQILISAGKNFAFSEAPKPLLHRVAARNKAQQLSLRKSFLLVLK